MTTRMCKVARAISLLLFCSATAVAQQSNHTACALSSYTNGQIVTLRGTFAIGAHDMMFSIPGCQKAVVLAYREATKESPSEAHPNGNLKLFKKYTNAFYEKTKKHPYQPSPMYRVQATLTGKLEVATIPPGTTKDSLGLLHDASGKIVGMWGGWGHPVPFAAYRLVIYSATDVKAQKLSRP